MVLGRVVLVGWGVLFNIFFNIFSLYMLILISVWFYLVFKVSDFNLFYLILSLESYVFVCLIAVYALVLLCL